jgi:hypothetical protein
MSELGGNIDIGARATRGLRRPSRGFMARLGVPVGGRVRKLRAVGDPLASPLLGRWEANLSTSRQFRSSLLFCGSFNLPGFFDSPGGCADLANKTD